MQPNESPVDEHHVDCVVDVAVLGVQVLGRGDGLDGRQAVGGVVIEGVAVRVVHLHELLFANVV